MEQTGTSGGPRAPQVYRFRRRARRALPKRIDRWRWRRRIRSRPGVHFGYRIVVATVGVVTIIVAASIGWLPGPGGIPLALVGLAILASEFVWAHQLLGRARRGAHDLARWSAAQPPLVRNALAAGTAATVLIGLWLILVVTGVPTWMPGWLATMLDALPGIRRL